MLREIAKVLLEYEFVYPRPPTIPKNKTSFIIATYKGLHVDWPIITTNSLKAAIAAIAGGKKTWCKVAQRLTILAPPQLCILIGCQLPLHCPLEYQISSLSIGSLHNQTT